MIRAINSSLLGFQSDSFKDNNEGCESLEKRFSSIDLDVNRVIKLCYISLAVLFRPDFLSDTEREKEQDRKFNETVSVNLISTYWCELLGLNAETGEKDDGPHSNSGEVWKTFFTDHEKEAFFEYASPKKYHKAVSKRIRNLLSESSSKACRCSFQKKNVLYYIFRSLIDLDLIQFVSFNANEDVINQNDNIVEIKDTKQFEVIHDQDPSLLNQVNFIALNRQRCYKYGTFLCSLPRASGGFFIPSSSTSPLNRMNQVIIDACIRSHLSSVVNQSASMDEFLVYALSMLPYHLMRSEKINEAFQLLVARVFIIQRIRAMGIVCGTKRHIEDCQNLYYLFLDKKKENHMDALVKPLQKLSEFLKHLSTEGNSKEISLAYFDLAFKAEAYSWKEGAIKFYTESIRLHKEGSDDNNFEVVQLLCKLGNIYININNYEGGIKCYEQAIAKEKKNLGEIHPRIAKLLTKLARFYFDAKNVESSLLSYNELLDMQETMFGSDNADVARTYKNLGVVHHFLKNYEKAMLCYFKAIRITNNIRQKNYPFLSEVYCHLGGMYREVDDPKTAIQSLDEAINYGIKYKEKNFDAVARAHHEKGLTLAYTKDFRNSISSYEKSLVVTRCEFNRYPDRIAQILQDLAAAHRECQQYSKAVEKLKEAKSTLSFEDNQNSVVFSNIHKNIAECYESMGQFTDAIENYQIVVNNEKIRVGNNIAVADLLQYVGDICILNESNDLAMKCFQEALEIRTTLHESFHLEAAALKHRLGTVLCKLNENDKALECFREALHIRNGELGEDHELVSDTLHNMALVYKNNGEYLCALELYKKALEIRVLRLGQSHIKVADTLYNMGVVQAKLDDVENAIINFELAFKTNLAMGTKKNSDKLDNIMEWMSFLRNESKFHGDMEMPIM